MTACAGQFNRVHAHVEFASPMFADCPVCMALRHIEALEEELMAERARNIRAEREVKPKPTGTVEADYILRTIFGGKL